MRILIDIGHPGHVHLFKHFAMKMSDKGHSILFTCREKEFEAELLRSYGFQFISFGKKFRSTIGKISGLLKFDLLELKAALKFRPDIFLSHGSPYAAHAAWLLQKPHISLEDTFNFEQIRLYKPFTDVILTSTYSHPELGEKNIKYSGYHELAYLHPKVFEPNAEILKELGIKSGEKYVIMRFISWNATHDIGHKGMSLKDKLEAVNRISKYAKVFISSENELPSELKKYKFPLSPNKMHDVIAFAELVFGESATMATEGAVLGVPAIYIDNTSRFYTKDIETNFGTLFNYSESDADQLKAIDKACELLLKQNIDRDARRKKIAESKINVTEFLVWFVENYPGSKMVMKKDPQYQLNFR